MRVGVLYWMGECLLNKRPTLMCLAKKKKRKKKKEKKNLIEVYEATLKESKQLLRNAVQGVIICVMSLTFAVDWVLKANYLLSSYFTVSNRA